MAKKIVVIGGVACGPKAAARAKRINPELDIVLVERGHEISYGACGLPFYLEDEVEKVEALTETPVGVARNAGFFKAVKGIEIRTGTEAVKIDRKAHKVTVRDVASGSEEELDYDKLVLATGSSPVRPPLPGIDLAGIHCLKTMEDARAIKEAIGDGAGKKAVIVGGGLIGMECVEPLLKAGFEVHIVEMLPHVLKALLDEDIASLVMKTLAGSGVVLHCNQAVREFVDDGSGAVGKVRTDSEDIDADLVVLAIGFRPNTELAEQAGLETGRAGIVVDRHMRTSDPDIYAGGDCVESVNLVTGQGMYAPMGSTANKHGRVIGNNLAGWNSTFSGVCGTGVCRIMGLNIARTGLTMHDAEAAGLKVVTAICPGPDKPHYMKGSKPVILKLMAEKRTGRILGMQAVGQGEVLSRVDTVAALLKKSGTVDDLAEVDMAYAPPFSQAIDNLIVAANVIQNKMDGIAATYAPAELKARIDDGGDFIMLDVRTPAEVEQMYLPYDNVVHIPLGKVREKAGELPRDKEIVALCKISLRGYEAARMLEAAGFDREKIRFLDGGIVAWPYEKVVK
jgi:NADPH-dependent 2,4-dienoyl-CoA reductase/sulfur reductase-like enzyme/rhodanese-related sulfurtransferase